MSKSDTNLIWCGPEAAPSELRKKYARTISLYSEPTIGNVHLKVRDISSKLAHDLPAVILDLLDVGSYVYCADQSVRRGGKVGRGHGRDWYRNFRLEIPVRAVELWDRPEVKDSLAEVLGFLSDDSYEFRFRKLTKNIPADGYFDFDEGKPWFPADEVLAFSGGLDSLAGAIDQVALNGKKVVLVSHRPVTKTDKAQRDLVSALRERYDARGRLLHIPVWVNKHSGLTKDANQRSRSFLYSAIATVVASQSGCDTIKFYENGIVSCNLPIADQVVGARASRTTRPETLKLMSELYSALLNTEFRVENPYLDKTKTDVLSALASFGATDLIKTSHSCTRTRSTTKVETHCGVCSQCIERRLAVMWNGLEEHDPAEMYKTDLFHDKLARPEDVRMVESYIQHARTLEELDIDAFFGRFPDGFSMASAMDFPAMKAGQVLYDLHHRHGKQVGEVIKRQIKVNADLIRTGEIEPKSLLGMIVSASTKGRSDDMSLKRFPMPKGKDWKDVKIELVSNDSLVVRVGDTTKRCLGFDMGFRDGRRVDMLNKQWELLETLAESDGVLDRDAVGLKRPTQKRVEELSNTLKRFFGLNENPMHRYKKGTGWIAKFKITDKATRKT